MTSIASARRQAAIDEIMSTGMFQTIEWLEATDSTNRYLSQSVRTTKLPLPALVVADSQTAGVGRGSNRWWSPSGCLMFSMAIPLTNSFRSPPGLGTIDPKTDGVQEHALLPLKVGFAVAHCLEPLVKVRPMVKWPNDVYLAGKKVSGVLIECVSRPRAGSTGDGITGGASDLVAIVGVGINCVVDFEQAPEPVPKMATSVHTWLHREHHELVSVESILVHFVHAWMSVAKKQIDAPEWIEQEWPERSLLHHGWVQIKHASGVTMGRCVGIDARGALLVQDEQLQTVAILAGEVQSFRTVDR